MYEKSNSLVYVFAVNCQFFPNNSVRVCPVKLKIDMLHHMNNTFWNTVVEISVGSHVDSKVREILNCIITAM